LGRLETDTGLLIAVQVVGRPSQDGPRARRSAGARERHGGQRHTDLSLTPGEENGNVISTRKYDVYGGVKGSSGPSGTRHKFVGQLGHTSDDETGLIYMRARYMDPVMGRFVSEDPAQNGVNWYVYCDNSPTNKIDPSGKFPWLGAMIWIVGIFMLQDLMWQLRRTGGQWSSVDVWEILLVGGVAALMAAGALGAGALGTSLAAAGLLAEGSMRAGMGCVWFAVFLHELVLGLLIGEIENEGL